MLIALVPAHGLAYGRKIHEIAVPVVVLLQALLMVLVPEAHTLAGSSIHRSAVSAAPGPSTLVPTQQARPTTGQFTVQQDNAVSGERVSSGATQQKCPSQRAMHR